RRRRSDAAQCEALQWARLVEPFRALNNSDFAGRATTAAATHRGMRKARPTTRLQNRKAPRHRNDMTSGISDADAVQSSGLQSARRTQTKDPDHQGDIYDC